MVKPTFAALAAAASVVFAVACQQKATSPSETSGLLGPEAPSFDTGGVPNDGSGNKIVTEFADHQVVDCGGGVMLDFSNVGWIQTRFFGPPNNRNLAIQLFHSVITYANPATGETIQVRDVGPNRFYFRENGDLVLELSGRAPSAGFSAGFFGFIGHVVFNITNSEFELVAGQFLDLDAIACERLA